MRFDAACAMGAGITSALIVGLDHKLAGRGSAIWHLALATAAASAVVFRMEHHARADKAQIFHLGRHVGAIERDSENVVSLRARAR